MGKRIKIPGRLESAETGNIVAGANAIKDDTRGKTQVVVNNELEAAILTLAEGKQNVLTFDQTPTEDSTNPVTSGGVYAADQVLSQAIEAILLLIPSAASALNKLVDLATMNSSIATATASFKGTYNLASDLHLSVSATHAQIAAALDALSLDADNNDYTFVQVPNTDTAPTEIKKTERYKFNGTNWAYEYDLNNSGFTSAQWSAINSGITTLLVAKLLELPTNEALTLVLAGKQDNLTFDNAPTADSNNPVKSSGIYTCNAEIVAMINALDTAKQNVLTFDTSPTNGSMNPVTSNGIYVAISALQATIVALDNAKQNVLTFDSTPTLGSNNPVTSSGIKTQLNRIDGDIVTLNNLYQALTQSALVIVEPADTWPVASPDEQTIYRVVDRVNTPPQYYSDYMWNGTTMVLMATYDNAIDDEPTPNSHNLVESGGVKSSVFGFAKESDSYTINIVSGSSVSFVSPFVAPEGTKFIISFVSDSLDEYQVGFNYYDGTSKSVYLRPGNSAEIVATKKTSQVWVYRNRSNYTTTLQLKVESAGIVNRVNVLEEDAKEWAGKVGKVNDLNKIIYPALTDGYGIDYTTGEVVAYGPAKLSEVIDCSNYDNFYLQRTGFDALVFYDANGNKIKPVGSGNYTTFTKQNNVPANAVSFRFSTNTDANFVITNGLPNTRRNFVQAVNGMYNAVGNAIDVRGFASAGDGFDTPYTGDDNAAGFINAIKVLAGLRGGKLIVPSAHYSISTPIVLDFSCINIEGEIWNYSMHPNGVYESPNGTKIKIASQDIPAILIQRVNDTNHRADGFRIAQIGLAGTVSNGATKGLFSLADIEKNCGILVKSYIDQYEIERVNCEGLAAGFVCNDGGLDAGIIEKFNADGCNIGLIARRVTSSGGGYYAKFLNNILSDCPAFGMYIDGGAGYNYLGFEIVGNVMVRNGGGFTDDQITDFGGDNNCAAVVVKGVEYATISKNTIMYAGLYNNVSSGSVVEETQERKSLIFDGKTSIVSDNIIKGEGEVNILGSGNSIVNNFMDVELIIDGTMHHVCGNKASKITLTGNANLIEHNMLSSGVIDITGSYNMVIVPQSYTVNDTGTNNTIIRLQ